MRFDPSNVDWTPTRHPGISLKVLHSDESSGDTAVLIRMDPGCGYPRHRHRGAEDVFVLQGGYRDEGGEYSAGDFRRFPAGSAHSPVALEGSAACILFAVAHGGVEVLRDGSRGPGEPEPGR